MTPKLYSKPISFQADCQIRSVVEADINKIKWSLPDWNSYWQDKWRQKLEGKLDMYVVAVEDFPIARIWLDWTKSAKLGIGEISSFEVMPPFRNIGIGSFMIESMEDILREKGLKRAQIGVDKSNDRAKKLYQKLGYKVVRDEQDSFVYFSESGEQKTYSSDCWFLHKMVG